MLDNYSEHLDDIQGLRYLLFDRATYSAFTIEEITSLLHPSVDHSINGAKGFLAFTAAIDRHFYSSDEELSCVQIANKSLSNSDVWAFICREYGIQDKGISEAAIRQFHRNGMTSYVLRVTLADGSSRALKILKYRFTNTISIAEGIHTAPRPTNMEFWSKGKCHIAMTFVDGETLTEFLGSAEHSLKATKHIVKSLCHELASADTAHGDLNPNNIIVVRNSAEHTFSIRLIDFGVNTLLQQNSVGDAKDLANVSKYLAPEILDDPHATISADIFSFGIILAEMLASISRKTRSRSHTRTQIAPDTERMLDDIQIDSAGLAIFIDSMIERSETFRLSEYDKLDRKVYLAISQCLSMEFELLEAKQNNTKLPVLLKVTAPALSLLSGDPTMGFADKLREAKALIATQNEITGSRVYRDIAYLSNWSLVATLMHTVVVVAFFYYAKKYIDLGLFEKYWPGLVILLSFSFVAVRYYQAIFSDIDIRALKNASKITKFWIRFCSFYWPPAILLVYHFDPSYWCFAAFYGTCVVAINNYLCWSVAQRMIGELADEGLEFSLTVSSWLRSFRSWFELMLVYSFGILAIGILVILGVLNDIAAYTLIILLVNFKLWYYNAGRIAPQIRSSLLRVYQRYRRYSSVALLST